MTFINQKGRVVFPKKGNSVSLKWIVPVFILFALCSYGTTAGKMGIYWDDWAYIWTRLELGFHGLLRHFSFSRPVAGQLHNIAILITNGNPLAVQWYGLVMRVLCGCAVCWFVSALWHESSWLAATVALLFIAYPGFNMQPVGINFSFSFFLIGALCVSFALSLKAMRAPKISAKLVLIALFLELLNLFASEYFFLLELLRPLIFWIALSNEQPSGNKKFKRVLKYELPYMSVFILGMIYRLFFNKTQTLHYDFSLVEKFKNAPLKTLCAYFAQMAADCWKAVFPAWARVFQVPSPSATGERTFLVYLSTIGIMALVTGLFLFFLKKEKNPSLRNSLQCMVLGLASLPIAGQPFWLTETQLSFIFPNSRYTLPFMLGTSLFLAGALTLLSRKKWVAIILTALLVGFSTGYHFDNASAWRRDWTLTKNFFWQLKWRIPALEENTVVITNQLPIRFSTDNSLTAPLNWIYASSYENDTMPYMLYTNTKRENTLSKLAPRHEIFQEYLSAKFYGNTDDAVSVFYQAPGCVHVLDPQVDLFNQMIPIIDRDAALLNNYARIITDAPYKPLPEKQFGAEPERNWCWYYETADLARQQRNWEKIAALGDEAFSLADHPNDPMERIPFIEGYAHYGDWEKAIVQTEAALDITPLMNNPLCALWQRIEQETSSLGKAEAIRKIDGLLECAFLRDKSKFEGKALLLQKNQDN